MLPFNTALELLNTYGNFPETRQEQVALLRSVGYRSLRGGGPLAYCKEEQVRAVAHRLLEDAERVVRQEVRYVIDQIAREDRAQFLYEIFNIPEDQREDISPAELEERLLE